MSNTQPTHKDVAEFFRLSLLAGFCGPSSVAQWADDIVAAEQSPDYAYIELCSSHLRAASIVRTQLSDVPGKVTSDLPFRMLLGHAARLLMSSAFSPEHLLQRLYHVSNLETFSEDIASELIRLEDGLSLARDGIYGDIPTVFEDIANFLSGFHCFAPCVVPASKRSP
jgi:hypothetical protein